MFDDSFFTEINVPTEAATAIRSKFTEFEAIKTKEIEDKYSSTANTNAQRILEGAAKKVSQETGISMNEGEKLADYYSRAWTDRSTQLANKIKEYDEKIVSFKGNDTLSKEFTETKEKLNKLLAKEADYQSLIDSGISDKYQKAIEENESLKKSFAFSNSKPSIPESVNKYEFDAKWKAFEMKLLKDHDLVIENGEGYAVSKDNIYMRHKISDLVSKDNDLQELINHTTPKGFGSSPVTLTKIEGVPFDVPKGADAKTRGEMIAKYLASENIPVTSDKYGQMFSDLNQKILNAK